MPNYRIIKDFILGEKLTGEEFDSENFEDNQ